MSKVIAAFTMSLDGYVAGPNDEVGPLFAWYRSGDTDFPVAGTGMVFKIDRRSAAYLQEAWGSIGAIVTGRRDFDVSQAWGGQSPLGVPIFIVTHHPPAEWVNQPGTPFTFVTEGVAQAIRQARQVAGEKDVALSGTHIVRQALEAGLVDELQIELAPILLGGGIRLFETLSNGPLELEIARVIDTPAVTHLLYRVARRGG